jgi:hypothetical protein
MHVDAHTVDSLEATKGDLDVAHLAERGGSRGGGVGHVDVSFSAHGRPVWITQAAMTTPPTSTPINDLRRRRRSNASMATAG